MEVIYGLIPGMILIGLLAVGVLFWAARSGQFDDLVGDAYRILMDDDEDPPTTHEDLGSQPGKDDEREPADSK